MNEIKLSFCQKDSPKNTSFWQNPSNRVGLLSPSMLYTHDFRQKNREWQPIFSLYLCIYAPLAPLFPTGLCNLGMRTLKNTVLWTVIDSIGKKLKKPPEKVAYFSRNSVVSRIFYSSPNSQDGRFHVPKYGLQSNCIQNWGKLHPTFKYLIRRIQLLSSNTQLTLPTLGQNLGSIS